MADISKMADPVYLVRSTTNPEELTSLYNTWSKTYEQDVLGDTQYTAHVEAVAALENMYTTERENLNILDVGVGTGALGAKMKSVGFNVIDGLDPSSLMLEKAKETGAYRNLYCQFFTAEPSPGLQEGSYDVIVSSGVFVPGHVPFDAVIEAVRLVKPGGVICMVSRTSGAGNITEYIDNLSDIVSTLQREGKLEILRKENCTYDKNVDGILLVLKVN